MRRVPKRHTEQARALRSNATEQKRALWLLLSRYRPKFTRQLPIGPYKADLACRQARLIVGTSCSPAKAGVQGPALPGSVRRLAKAFGSWTPAFAGERSGLIGLKSRRSRLRDPE